MSPRPSLAPTEDGSYAGAYQQQAQDAYAATQNNNNNNNTTGGSTASNSSKNEPGRRAGACRVCLKSFKPDDYHKTCFECQQRVCEDCASYSKLEESEDAVSAGIKEKAECRVVWDVVKMVGWACKALGEIKSNAKVYTRKWCLWCVWSSIKCCWLQLNCNANGHNKFNFL